MTNETEIIIGKVQSVDTGNISVKVDTEALLNSQPLKTTQNIDL